MYKYLIIGTIILIGGIMFANYLGVTTTVVNEQVERVIDNTPEWVERVAEDEDAKAAAMAVLRQKELKADLSQLESEQLAENERHDQKSDELDVKIMEIEKELGTYWKDVGNIKAYIKKVFVEEPLMAVEVARRESTFRMVQSNFVYTAKNVPSGYSIGDQEESYCIFQIHKPAHHKTATRLGLEDYATNMESCVQMAYVIYKSKGDFSDWSVAKDILAFR